MTVKRAPNHGARTQQLLAAIQQGPATFYQLCERANIDVDTPTEEDAVHAMLGNLLGKSVRFDGLLYRPFPAPRHTPAAGEVAGPAYRGVCDPRTVYITRRPEGARV